jgi:hypothetical protein
VRKEEREQCWEAFKEWVTGDCGKSDIVTELLNFLSS